MPPLFIDNLSNFADSTAKSNINYETPLGYAQNTNLIN